MNTQIVDFLENDYQIIYDNDQDKYFILDTSQKQIKELIVKYNPKRKVYYIRYTYTFNGKRNNYQKTIDRIKWDLFGEWSGGNKPLIGLNDEDCKRVIQNHFNKLGYLVPFSQMRDSSDHLIKKVHLYLERNGGFKRYLKITDELNLNSQIYYQDHNGTILKSSFEFKFFCILHFNQIEYEYEPFKIETFVPDFFIPKFNLIIEILGLGTRFNYNEKSKQKRQVYSQKGHKYEPISVDGHNSTKSIFLRCQEIFGELKLPDFQKYFLDFSLNGDKFIIRLKELLQSINRGELIIDDEVNGNGFVQKYRTYYNYVYENYSSIFHSIKDLIGYPSINVKRPKNYWLDNRNCEYELEEIFKRENHIPNVHQSQTVYSGIYILRQFYSQRGVDSVKEGGEFFDFIETLKLKYGFRDIEKEKVETRETQIHDLVMKYYRQEITLTGKGSIDDLYGWIYDYLREKKGGVFQYIKENIGYPPPHIQRPKGYYENSENVEYELEHNWKKYKRLLRFSETKGERGKENTFNSLYSILGMDEFKKGGKFYPFVLYLQKTYGFDDVESKESDKFEQNVKIYLQGINDGKWNSTTDVCPELGKLQRYFKYVENHYGSLFDGVKQVIGYPHPRVGRYKHYYDDISNCKYEIENNIRIFKILPKYSDLKKHPYIGNNTLIGIYTKYKSSSFEKGGIFYDFTQQCLIKYNKTL